MSVAAVCRDLGSPTLRSLALHHVEEPGGWRFHGLGMVQKYLTPDVRIHVWHPSLFRFGEEESVHDHRFDLISHVVYGSIRHIEADLERDDAGGTHKVWRHGNQDLGGQDEPEEQPGSWRIRETAISIAAGSVYSFPRARFHRTEVDGLAVTVIHRGPRSEASHALFPVGVAARHGTTVASVEDIAAELAGVLADAAAALRVRG